VSQPGKTIESIEAVQAHLQQQLAEQALLLQVSQTLATSFELDNTMPQVVDCALKGTKADAARLVLLSGEAPIVYSTGTLNEQLAPYDTAVATIADSLKVPDTAANTHFEGISSAAGAFGIWPLNVEKQLLGVLWVAYNEPHTFTETEDTFLITLASQAAVAVANAQLFQESQNGRQWLAAVLGSTADPILVIDRAQRISLINHAAEDVLGITAQSALGKQVQDILADFPNLLRFFANDTALAEDEEWESPDGRAYSPRLSRVEKSEEDSGNVVLTLRDITSFKQLNRNQAEFVRLISHDLRSPLTYMQGFASLLSMAGTLNERQEGFVEKILSGITQMTGLVDNIQDAGRWDPETGFYEMSREPADVTGIVQDIVANHKEVARKQNITLTSTLALNIPIINIDSLMVQRALNNLVTNAIKYSPDGGDVDVSVQLEDESIVICVSDTGLGIAPEHVGQLFQRGTRIVTEAIKKNKIKGSGLGLFIVRSVARRHGGNAWVESEVGKGSRFYFSIPLRGANLLGGSW
jgi:PAS domain S-box-containing protein